ncbi:MAG: hypothetical protein IKM34_07040 [Clostridia bacterium]|nr:hypothetical protein [Clostridia bacterium]
MRTKIIAITIMCFLLFLMTGCSNKDNYEKDWDGTSGVSDDVENPSNSDNPESPKPDSSTAPIQPIHFSSIQEMITFIDDPYAKTNSYPEREKDQYLDMTKSFKASGWIYSVTTVDGQKANDIAIYPKTTYEDSGFSYYFVYNDKSIQVLIYKIEELSNTTQRLNMRVYIDERFGFEGIKTEMDNVNNIYLDSPLFWAGKSMNSIWGFLDEKYYMVIKSELSQEDMKSFVSTIKLERIIANDIK